MEVAFVFVAVSRTHSPWYVLPRHDDTLCVGNERAHRTSTLLAQYCQQRAFTVPNFYCFTFSRVVPSHGVPGWVG